MNPPEKRPVFTRFHWSVAIAAAFLALVCIFFSGPARLLLAAGGLAAFGGLTAWGVYDLSFQFFGPSISRAEPGRKMVALTFDDGPDPLGTPEALKVLAAHGVKAAFFMIGTKVAQHPDLAAAVVRAGHIAANHSHNHAWWTNFLMGRALNREIVRAQEEITKACGRRPAFFRPPVGLSNPHLHKALRKSRLTMIGWSVRSYDLNNPAEKVVQRVVKKTRDGDVILLHDRRAGQGELRELLEGLIPALKEKGFNLAALDEALGLPAYQDEEARR